MKEPQLVHNEVISLVSIKERLVYCNSNFAKLLETLNINVVELGGSFPTDDRPFENKLADRGIMGSLDNDITFYVIQLQKLEVLIEHLQNSIGKQG